MTLIHFCLKLNFVFLEPNFVRFGGLEVPIFQISKPPRSKGLPAKRN